MSGGHFEYRQYNINVIADEIQELIDNNGVYNKEWDETIEYSDEEIEVFRTAIVKLREAYVYAQRIDWYVSGDDGEDSFKERLSEDLEKLKDDIN